MRVHSHLITTEVATDLGEFAEILDDESVEMIPLRYRGGCRTFQTASHISMRCTILHLYNVVEHNDMLSIGIHQQPCYTVLSTLLGSDFEVLGHL